MTITVDLPPDVQAELTRQAAAEGREVEEHAAILLEAAVHRADSGPRLSQDRLENTLQEMAQFSTKIQALPDDALARASLYRDHD